MMSVFVAQIWIIILWLAGEACGFSSGHPITLEHSGL